MTNVLLIYSDDMRFDFLPYMPNVRRLLCREGTTFTEARCNVGLCQPSRVGLLTGQWATTSGFNAQTAAAIDPGSFDHSHLLARWMHDVGYRTGMFGKYMNFTVHTPDPGGSSDWGWDVWRQLVGPEDSQHVTLPYHDTDQELQYGFVINDEHNQSITIPEQSPGVAKSANDYLREEVQAFITGAGQQPWFCYYTPTSPHIPFNAPAGDLFAWSHVRWRIVLESDEQTATKPSWIRLDANGQPNPGISAQQVAQFQAVARAQLRELVWLDQEIATIVEGMSSTLLANTVIVFASDNGLNYGEHRNTVFGSAKNELYDVSLRVPCVIRGLDNLVPGTSTDAPVSIGVDLTATICAIAGAEPRDANSACLRLDGVDLGGTLDPDRVVLAQRKGLGGGAGNNPNDGDAIITPTRKLMRWRQRQATATDPNPPEVAPADVYELYHLDADPDELTNLASVNTTERDTLAAQLESMIAASSSTPTVPCPP